MEISVDSIGDYVLPVTLNQPIRKQVPGISFKFEYCPKVVVLHHPGYNGEIISEFYHGDSLSFTSRIGCGMFSTLYPRWISDWRIKAKTSDGKLVEEYSLIESLKKDSVRVNFDSSSLGDTLSWMPYVDIFQEKYQISDLTVASFYNNLFESVYPRMKFETPNYYPRQTTITVGLGWYVEDDRNMHKNDPRTIPLQKVASDILGLDYSGEIRPKIAKRLFLPPPSNRKYICITTESTAGAKLWNFPDGWQMLVDMLVTSGFDVVNIQRGANTLKNVIDRTGSLPLEERISDLLQCEFFIGLGSGLSWLAWSLEIPVVMISGFSMPFCEFSDKTLRIINNQVCHGCFNNPEYKFDRSWWWCPVNANTPKHFECTKTITPENVYKQILSWQYYPKFN